MLFVLRNVFPHISGRNFYAEFQRKQPVGILNTQSVHCALVLTRATAHQSVVDVPGDVRRRHRGRHCAVQLHLLPATIPGFSSGYRWRLKVFFVIFDRCPSDLVGNDDNKEVAKFRIRCKARRLLADLNTSVTTRNKVEKR